MCGLFGIIGNKNIDINFVRSCLINRGPDFSKSIEFDNSIFFHSRLSIQDLSHSANQPFLNKKKNIALLFNGEIYNCDFLRKKLVRNNIFLNTNCDTEIILKGFEFFGFPFLKEIDGIYAVAIWDNTKKELILTRDPFGIKPLYYSLDNSSISFASEISVFKGRDISKESIRNYQLWGSILEPLSGLEGIKKFPCGYIGRWKYGNELEFIEKKEVNFISNNIYDPKKYLDIVSETKKILENCIKLQTVGDVEIASFLSGGVDSAILTGLLQKNTKKNIRSFSIGFEGFGGNLDESNMASISARYLGTEHKNVIYKKKDFEYLFDDFIEALDAPSCDGFNTYLVSKAVSDEGIKVAFSGLGADEIFAGYPHFKDYLTFLKKENKNFTFGGNLPLQILKKFKFENRAYSLRKMSAYLDHRKIPFHGLKKYNLDRLIRLRSEKSIDKNDELFKNNFSDMSLSELTGYVRDTLLRDTDAVSMHFGLEVRVPYLDLSLVNYCLSIPFEFHLHKGPKSILKEAFKEFLHPEIFNRKKTGFVIPLGEWIVDNKRFSPLRISSILRKYGIPKRVIFISWTYLLTNKRKWHPYWRWIVLAEWVLKREKYI